MSQFDDSVQQIEFTRDSKLSKMAVISFLMMVGGFSVFFGGPVKSVTMLLPAMFCGAYSWIHIKDSDGHLKGKLFAIPATIIPAMVIISAVTMFFVWRFDAEPIEGDLTVADLYQAGDKYDASFDLLHKLAETETKVLLGISEKINSGDSSAVKAWVSANRDKILSDWEKTSQARDIIDALDGFSQIADMTDPNMSNVPEVFNDFMYLTELHSGYMCLQNQLGSGSATVEHFVRLDSVLKKIQAHARSSMISEMCGISLSFNVMTANYIVNCSDTDAKTLEVLAGHFRPLANDYTSLRNGVIFNYLQRKATVHEAAGGEANWLLSPRALLKPNSFCRVCRNYCDDNLAILSGVDKRNGKRFSAWPEFFPQKIKDMQVSIGTDIPVPYLYYNIYSSSLLEEMAGSFGRRLAADVNYKILNDLLIISLNKRLGKEVSLKARAYSDEYIIDIEKEIIFSPGADGESYTDDDIKLFVEPTVLKL